MAEFKKFIPELNAELKDMELAFWLGEDQNGNKLPVSQGMLNMKRTEIRLRILHKLNPQLPNLSMLHKSRPFRGGCGGCGGKRRANPKPPPSAG